MYNSDAVDGIDNPFKPSKRLQRTPPKGAPTEATKAPQETVVASQIHAPSTSKEKEEVSIIKETPFGVTANETVADLLQQNNGVSTAPAPTTSLCDIQQPEAPAAAEKIVDHPSKMVEASDVAPAAAAADIEKVTTCPPSSTADPENVTTEEGVETLGEEEHKVEEKEGEEAAAAALPAEHVPDQVSSKEESVSIVAVASQTGKEVASPPIEEMSTTNLATNAAAVQSSTEIDIDDDNNVEAEASAGMLFRKAVNEDSSPPTTVITEEKKAPLHSPVAAEAISPPTAAVVPSTAVLPPLSELPAVMSIATNNSRSSSKPEEILLTPSIVPSSSIMYAIGMIPAFSLRDVTQSLRLRTPTVSCTPVSAAAIAAPQEVPSQPKEQPQQEVLSQPQEQPQQKEEGQRQEEVQAAGKQQAAVMSSPASLEPAAMSSPAPMEMEMANPFVPRPKVARTPPPANACQDKMEQSFPSSPTQTTTSVCSSPVISTAALSPVPIQLCPEEAATISNSFPSKRVAESYSKAMPLSTTCASSSAAACQTDELDLPQLLTVKETLTRQETELQEELGVLRSDLMKQKVESERLMETWSQAQAALKNSGQELDGVQRERRRLSVNLSRLTKELTLTKEHIKPLVGEGDAAREELWQLKLEQLRSCNELTGSVRVFDRLCERERRLKIKLLHEEAASYEVRSAYLKDYKVMCGFSRNVTVKALELANRVKERVKRLKEVFKAQQRELQRKVHDADMQAKEARNHDMSRLKEMQSREAEHEKAVLRLEEGKCKAEERLAEAEGKADKEVRKLEALLSDRSEEIKRLEAEIEKLCSQDVRKIPTKTKVSKQKKNRPEMETQNNEMLSTLSKSADLPGGHDELLDTLDQSSQASPSSSSTAPPGKESRKGGSRKKRQAVTSDEEGPIPAAPGGKDSRKKRATNKAKEAVVETVVTALEEEKGDNEGGTALQTFSPCKAMEDEMMTVEETSLPSSSPQAVAADNESTTRSRGRKRENVSEGEKGAEPADKRGRAQQKKKGHATEVPAMEDPDPVVSMAVEETAPAPSLLRQISSNKQEGDAAIEPSSTKRSTAMNLTAAAATGNENDQNQQRNEAPRPPVARRPLPPFNTNMAKPQAARDKIKKMSIFSAFMDKKAIPALKKPT